MTTPKVDISYDPLHGYIPFTSPPSPSASEVSEREIIDHPWLQRLTQHSSVANGLVGVSDG